MDWNNDGNIDLIVGEYGAPDANIWYFERERNGDLKAGKKLECNGVEISLKYTSPCVVDWNNDGLLDLIVGEQGDNVPRLYINDGTRESYHFSLYEEMKDQFGNLLEDYRAGQVMVDVSDLDNDGDKDVIMCGRNGNMNGENFYFYENVGTDAVPLLKSKTPLEEKGTWFNYDFTTSGPSYTGRFTLWDWNGDGYEDLIWADSKELKPEVNGITPYTNPIYISFSTTNGDIVDTEAPVVAVFSPQDGETFTVGTEITAKWSATDNVGVTAVTIDFSDDNGQSWTRIDSLATNSGTHSWSLPDRAATTCLIKVTAFDAEGNKSEAQSGVFSVEDGTGTVGLTISESRFEVQCGISELVLISPLNTTGDITLYSLTGRQVAQYRGVHMKRGTNLLAISEIGQGTYLLKVLTEKQDLVKMISIGQ